MNTQRILPPWPLFETEEIEAVRKVLESGKVNYWTGDECREFEREFAEHCGAKHSIALANGTVALELALEAAGIGPGDEVVVTPRSFVASASCAVRVGAIPVFADVDLRSQNISAEAIEAVLSDRTRAIITVHHAGWPCDMDEIMSLAAERNIVVVEDCAQAHGATYNGRPVGGIGHVAAFSFCQDKIMTTGGEGGMLVTNDDTIWKRAWSLKDHGKNYDSVYRSDHPPGFRWLHDSIGTNWRMTEMQGAIARVQLGKLSNWTELRTRNARQLADALSRSDAIHVPMPSDDRQHAFYRLYAFVQPERLSDGWSRDRIVEAMMAAHVPVFTGSCPEIYNEKAFSNSESYPNAPLPNAVRLGETSLAFLVHPTLSEDDMGYLCEQIASVIDSV